MLENLEKPIVQRILKSHKNNKGEVLTKSRIGVLVAGISPTDQDSVVIGFSLCNKKDKYNCPGGKRVEDFDKEAASIRAVRWQFKDTVDVPSSIQKPLDEFFKRCIKYYKDKLLPNWVLNLKFNKENKRDK